MNKDSASVWLWWSCGILLLGVSSIPLYRIKCSRKKVEFEDTKEDNTQVEVLPVNETVEEVAVVEKYFFDRSRSAISLLGTFNVRDKDGNDITGAFTPRLKSLLILLVLYTEKVSKAS